jgi:hypothetical protein
LIEILGIAIGGLKAFGDNSLKGRRWHEFDLEQKKINVLNNYELSIWAKSCQILTTYKPTSSGYFT